VRAGSSGAWWQLQRLRCHHHAFNQAAAGAAVRSCLQKQRPGAADTLITPIDVLCAACVSPPPCSVPGWQRRRAGL
jgi:hypothetical protein